MALLCGMVLWRSCSVDEMRFAVAGQNELLYGFGKADTGNGAMSAMPRATGNGSMTLDSNS